MFNEKILKNEEKAIFALRSLYKSYGYLPFKMSKFEEYDLYASNKDFLVSDRVITFTDTDGKLLALKPDVTLSIIKNAAEDKNVKNKVYYNENVYRVSGSTGQFKEIMQTGLECIGNTDTNDILEVICLAAKSLESVSPNYVLDISHMGILSAILDDASDNNLFKKSVTATIAEKNAHDTEALCQKYAISKESTDAIISLTSMYGEMNSVVERLASVCTNGRAKAALFELRTVAEFLSKEPFSDKLRFDFSVVNDMNYYDGIVFKGFLSGICEGVLSGGEYGKLLSAMGDMTDGELFCGAENQEISLFLLLADILYCIIIFYMSAGNGSQCVGVLAHGYSQKRQYAAFGLLKALCLGEDYYVFLISQPLEEFNWQGIRYRSVKEQSAFLFNRS